MQAPSSSPGAPARAERSLPGELRNKLVWLTVFRLVAATALLAILAVRLWARDSLTGELSRDDSLPFGIVGAIYVLNLIYGVMLRRGWGGRGAAYVQVMGDVFIAASLVYLSGGAESPFVFIFPLAVVGGAILLQESGAFIAAAASSLTFCALSVAVQYDLLRPPGGPSLLPLPRLSFALSSNVAAHFLTAALAAYLSRQLSQAGGMLSAREADLKKLDRVQRQILASMPSGLLTSDPKGTISFVNRAGAMILGREEVQIAGRHLDQILPGLPAQETHGRRRELTIDAPGGQRTLGMTVAPLDETGALLVVFQDLTELKRMQVELERVDRLAALGKLSAQLAHEIRNPLAAMRGSAQLLAQDATEKPSTVRLGAILVREADRLSRLVEDFLRFARPAQPVLSRVRLDELVAETLQMLRADPAVGGLQIDQELAPVEREVDPDQLRQVLLNLVRNAVQAVSPAGRVRVRLSQDASDVRLSVWDSAGSIPPSDLRRIFEPFYTTRSGGTGLGLSTAHAIVRAHGGAITVTSSPQTGTELTIVLPRAPQETRIAPTGS